MAPGATKRKSACRNGATFATLGCMSEQEGTPEPTKLPIDGTLDLHTFRPKEAADVVRAYLEECRAKGILEVRVIHGKGIGNLQRTVHALLSRHPGVAHYALASPPFGGSGATIVKLRADTKEN
jgi:DNA-nicking Smr family endonuclease